MISYEDVVENELIDSEVLYHIPSKCDCGGDIEFTESLKQISCSNPTCYHKVASRLESMCKELKVDGFGEATCLEICKFTGLISPYQAVKLKGIDIDTVSALDKKVDSLLQELSKERELWEVVSLGNIPSIDSISYKLFGKYNTVAEAYEDFETLQVPYIASLLGHSSGVMASTIYNTLLEYKNELLFAEKNFNIKKVNENKIIIAITGSVLGYSTKSEYVKKLNSILGDRAFVIRRDTVSKETNYLVCDNDSSSNKYKTALRLQESGSGIEILSSAELLIRLQEIYK